MRSVSSRSYVFFSGLKRDQDVSPDKLLEFVCGSLESDSPPRKRRRTATDNGHCVLQTEPDPRDYLTIARVDVDLVC